MLHQVISTINRRIQPLFLGNWTLSNGGPILYSLHLTRIKPSSHRIIPGTLQEHLVNPYTPGSDMVLQVLDQELGSQFYSAQNMCKVYKTSVFVQTPRASWEMISHTSYRNGYGSIPIDTFLVGWTSIYQLFWGSLGTRVLTHPQICIYIYMWKSWITGNTNKNYRPSGGEYFIHIDFLLNVPEIQDYYGCYGCCWAWIAKGYYGCYDQRRGDHDSPSRSLCSCIFMYPLVMTNIAIEHYWTWPIEIVDLAIKDGDVPVRYVSLPEGISH